MIGAGGVEKVIEIALDDAAKAGLEGAGGVSIDAVKDLPGGLQGLHRVLPSSLA